MADLQIILPTDFAVNCYRPIRLTGRVFSGWWVMSSSVNPKLQSSTGSTWSRLTMHCPIE